MYGFQVMSRKVWVFLLFIGVLFLMGLDNWVMLQDSQDNRYYRSQSGKMILPGKYRPQRRPVSAQNAEFYYNQALELLQQPQRPPKREAIRYLRSILLLPNEGGVAPWKKRSAQAISHYRKAWGSIFSQMENNLTFFRYEDLSNGEIYITLPRGFISLRYPASWRDIEVRRLRENYTLIEGVVMGNKGAPMEQMAVIYDRFLTKTFISVAEYRKLWHRRLKEKDYQRTAKEPLLPGSLSDSFHYTVAAKKRQKHEPMFPEQFAKRKHLYRDRKMVGVEHYVRKGNFGYYIAWTARQDVAQKKQKEFAKAVSSVKINP